jgi:class 3 adenylate cyclase
MSRSGRTSWRWCRCCSAACPAASWTRSGRPGWAAQLSSDFLPLVDPALLAAYRRQQELSWIEQLVEEIEAALEETGGLGRPERVPAMCFLDLVGYTRLTEEHGDQAAAELAETLAERRERP